MGDKPMVKAALKPNGDEPGTMAVIVVDLAGRRYDTRAPWGVDKITMAVGPIGAFEFLRTLERDLLSGAPIFRQVDTSGQAAQIEGSK